MKSSLKETPPLVVFDVGNVLLKFDFRRAAANFDRLEPGMGDRLCERLWFSPLGTRFETGRVTGPEVYRLLKKRLRFSMSYARFCRAFNDIFEPVAENLRLLSRLSRRGRTALLSNANPIHWRHIRRAYPALRRARWPYSSHMLGFMKPDPRIYRSLARRTGVPLDRMVFFDDRPENVAAARRLGMKAALYRDGLRLERELRRLNGGARG